MADIGLPAKGRSRQDIEAAMAAARADDLPWYGDRIFRGGSYFGGTDVVEVANAAYRAYINYNALFGKGWYPSLGRYDSEVVAMLLGMMGAPEGAAGSLTSGGTESILMAVKTAHDWARDRHPERKAPAIVLPHAAHPAFDKAAHMMGLGVARLSHSRDFRADVGAMARAITADTIMIVASAPSYPYGVTDPVAEIAALAEAHGLWLHVDACHGGFVLPFARKLGHPVPDYDFALAGVTSISIDVHKLGYANKGVSALLFRDAGLQAYQRYSFEAWPAGLYATDNITGSRSGGGVASAWAVMTYLGEAGYLKIVAEIVAAREALVAGIRAIDGLDVWGRPDAYLVAFGSAAFDIFAVGEALAERGWLAGRLSDPPSLHLFLNRAHGPAIPDFLADLAEVAAEARAGKLTRREGATVYAT